ncbi:hypothetical protein OSB04_023456 [Centaurea solstitialis]|uniref:Uncharacterized protein n=1 Tax=Centaurea solstitialis TaxID=347529 RepID=A0AA38SJ78_9ASTR|nr:hypothetical protein OSB04_023456 [Centaurea solstitialis]
MRSVVRSWPAAVCGSVTEHPPSSIATSELVVGLWCGGALVWLAIIQPPPPSLPAGNDSSKNDAAAATALRLVAGCHHQSGDATVVRQPQPLTKLVVGLRWFRFGGFSSTNIVSWKSTRQKSVSRLSTEAEYKALANASAELLWLKNLLHELGLSSPTTPTLFCNNVGATYLCQIISIIRE